MLSETLPVKFVMVGRKLNFSLAILPSRSWSSRCTVTKRGQMVAADANMNRHIVDSMQTAISDTRVMRAAVFCDHS